MATRKGRVLMFRLMFGTSRSSFITCHCSCRYDMTPVKMNNPSGQIQTQEVCWSRDELSVFKSPRVPKEKRERTYLATFLFCCHTYLHFMKLERELLVQEHLRLSVASCCTFIMVILVLARIYCGLNRITNARILLFKFILSAPSSL